MVLVLVMIVIALLSLAGYTFSEMMLAEHEATLLHGRAVQAHALADSGVEMTRMLLAQTPDMREQAGGLYDNPDQFMGMLVVDDETPHGRGRFTIVSSRIEEGAPGGIRYGLEDESTRLNLNTLLAVDKAQQGAGRKLLMGLPGMTEDVADAILDWIDPDDEIREFGAELNEYSQLDPPYAPKNGPLETIEELLLVRGVTPWLLFGVDGNRNGMADMHEGLAIEETTDGSENRGWSGYLTLYSQEANVNLAGMSRIDLNSDDLETLYNQILEVGGADWAGFIIAYRQFGPSNSGSSSGGNNSSSGGNSGEGSRGGSGNNSGGGSNNNGGGGNNNSGSSGGGGNNSGDNNQKPAPIAGRKPNLQTAAKTKIKSVLDLIGARVSAKFEGETQASLVESPFVNDLIAMNVYLPKLMDHFTATGNPTIPGRININQASRTVLLGIPGMTDEIVQRIIGERLPESGVDMPQRRYETWILSEGLVTLNEMKSLMPYVTAQGSVYRAQIIGYFEQGGPSARIEAVIDATTPSPRLVFWRDLSHLGRGFPPETLGVVFQ
jgi:DNA uptake protein ComE-like DNA-binding protein